MANVTHEAVSKTVEFLKSIGHEVSAEELESPSTARTEWTHKIPFIGQ